MRNKTIFVGRVIDLYYGHTFYVQADVDLLTRGYEHVYVTEGRHQRGDFPYGEPTNRLELAAQALIDSGSHEIEYSSDPESLIDWEGTLRMLIERGKTPAADSSGRG